MLSIVLTLVGCGGDPTPPFPGDCEAGAPITGVFDAATETCVLGLPLPEQCSEMWSWWREPGCPTFRRYVHETRPRGYPYSGTVPWNGPFYNYYSVTRCSGLPGKIYDVVVFSDGLRGDEALVTEAVFDTSGAMIWLRFADYFTQPGHELCCEPSAETTFWSGWGNPVHYDCTDGTVYTPADFPDSADTGAPTTGETADTGATCR